VIVLVDLPQGVADLEMRLIVICPVSLAAIDGDPAVGALELNVRRWRSAVVMIGMRAAPMLLDESGALPDFGDWRVRESVKEVVGTEHPLLSGL